MKILKYVCLMVVIVLLNAELFDLIDWQFWVISGLIGIYVGVDSEKD